MSKTQAEPGKDTFPEISDEHFVAERNRRDNARNRLWIEKIGDLFDEDTKISHSEMRALFAAVIWAFDLDYPTLMTMVNEAFLDVEGWRENSRQAEMTGLAEILGRVFSGEEVN